VPCGQVGFELQAVQVHDRRAGQFAVEQAIGLLQAFELARSHVAAFDDGSRVKSVLSAATMWRLRFSIPSAEIWTTSTSSYLSTIRPLRKSLSALTTRNEVAWAGGAAARPGPRGGAPQRKPGPPPRVRREHADMDLGFRVEKAHAEHPLAMVLDLHEFAIGGGAVTRRMELW